MPDDPDETSNTDDGSASVQTDLSPWESPDRGGTTETTTESDGDAGTPTDDDQQTSGDMTDAGDGERDGADVNEPESGSSNGEPDAAESKASTTDASAGESSGATSLQGVDWSHRQLGDEYPVDAAYHCNECNEFHADSISELKAHIETDETITWGEYLKASGLHRCAGCSEPLSTLTELYCEECTQSSGDRISCRNCGEVRVNISDPFCSAGCAGERIEATTGAPAPLQEPENPSTDWLNHPHRLKTGIPSSAPFIENHRMACRECYEYGADSLHSFAVHVSERHPDAGWGGYIHRYALRRCRVCDDALYSLLPLYCSDVCQQSDPDPARTCKRDGCGAAVERRQKYCSWECYKAADT